MDTATAIELDHLLQARDRLWDRAYKAWEKLEYEKADSKDLAGFPNRESIAREEVRCLLVQKERYRDVANWDAVRALNARIDEIALGNGK